MNELLDIASQHSTHQVSYQGCPLTQTNMHVNQCTHTHNHVTLKTIIKILLCLVNETSK